jgi:hypothetical protein
MSSLQDIASRLKDKMESNRRSGFTGETSPMERQIIEHLSALHQQVLELSDAVQASLQIIDDNRRSQRLKRASAWFRLRVASGWRLMESSALYKILSALGAVAIVWGVARFVFHLHAFR